MVGGSVAVWLVAAALLPLLLPARAQSGSSRRMQDASLEARIEAVVKQAHIPSMTAAVVKEGNIVWTGAFGTADRFAKPPVQSSVEGTSYLLASVSKTVAAVTLMQLEEQGLFNLDDDINDYLVTVVDKTIKFRVVHPRHPKIPITFRMLLTHTSGISDIPYENIPDKVAYTRNTDAPETLARFLFNYFSPKGSRYSGRRFTKTSAPGAKYDYSNVGASLAAYMVQVITGRDFATVSTENTIRAAGMNESRTSWHLQGFQPDLAKKLAMPSVWKRNAYKAYCHFTFPDYPDGGLRSTALDLALFLKHFMQDGGSLLSKETRDEMLRVQSELPGAAKEKQGLIWYYKRLKGRNLVGHNGSEMGTTTEMFFDPGSNIGIVLLINGEGPDSFYDKIDTIEDMLFKNFEDRRRQLDSVSPSIDRRRDLQRSTTQRRLRKAKDLCNF